MVDFVTSTVEGGVPMEEVRKAKQDAFLAIIDEEIAAGRCGRDLLDQIRSEIRERFG